MACDKFMAKNPETAARLAERRKPFDAYVSSQVD
jgi:hypothetical protein